MDLEAFRQLFPVCKKSCYLNNAAESPMNLAVKQALDDYTSIVINEPYNKKSPRIAVRQGCAALLGGDSADWALVSSTGHGIGMMARGYPWQKGDNVVLPALEHWNNTFPWLALQAQGVDVRLVSPGSDERVDPSRIDAAIDSRTRIVATAAVRFNTGFRADLKRLSDIAHAKGALFLVDAIQAAGVCPINVINDGIDILSAAAFKWLLGLPGSGALYVNAKARELIEPTMPGMFAAEDSYSELRYFNDARRYETGTIAYPLFHAWTAGLDLLEEIGIPNIHSRVLELTGHLIDGLRSRDIAITSPVDDPAERSAIVTMSLGDETANVALVERLASKGIIVAIRDGRVRISPNFYNTEEEIDRLVAAL